MSRSMAATAPKQTRWRRARHAAAFLILVSFETPAFADRAGDMRAQISEVSTALTSGNAEQAMVPFDKSYKNYDQLSGYFQSLSSFQIENEVDVTDEQDTHTGSTVVVSWTLTLTDPSTNRSEQRAADITVRLMSRGGKWKIVDFSPLDIFNPLRKQSRKR